MPLSHCNILILEDEFLIALDLELAVEDANGRVVGPASSIAMARKLLASERVDGAILDAHLPDGDVSLIVDELVARGIPFVIHTGTGLPEALAERRFPVFVKPTSTTRLMAELAWRIPRRAPRRPLVDHGAVALAG
jgi:DNA-binding NtrC family response regulator